MFKFAILAICLVTYIQGTANNVTAAQLTLGSPFQDRMVVQRDKPIKVWGTADMGANVSVSFNGSTVSGIADTDGSWQVELPAFPSDPNNPDQSHTLTVTNAGLTTTINDVLIGDVWLCFGQSNMVRPISELTNTSINYSTAIAAEDSIRCLYVHLNTSLTEEETAPMAWLANSTASQWTSVGSISHINSIRRPMSPSPSYGVLGAAPPLKHGCH